MADLTIDISKALPFVDQQNFESILKEVEQQYKVLLDGTGKGNDFLGWLHLPSSIQPDLISRIQQDAEDICVSSKIIVVIGIGGSYLGTRAIVDALSNPFVAYLPNREKPLLVYAEKI